MQQRQGDRGLAHKKGKTIQNPTMNCQLKSTEPTGRRTPAGNSSNTSCAVLRPGPTTCTLENPTTRRRYQSEVRTHRDSNLIHGLFSSVFSLWMTIAKQSPRSRRERERERATDLRSVSGPHLPCCLFPCPRPRCCRRRQPCCPPALDPTRVGRWASGARDE